MDEPDEDPRTARLTKELLSCLDAALDRDDPQGIVADAIESMLATCMRTWEHEGRTHAEATAKMTHIFVSAMHMACVAHATDIEIASAMAERDEKEHVN